MRTRFWADLTTEEIEQLDHENTVVVLPIAAIEQHGPHLPINTDMAIADGHIHSVIGKLPEDQSVFFLPTLAYGKSDEHLNFPGTVTLAAETLTAVIVEIGASLTWAGIRRLIIINSHGGNVEVMGIAARRLRIGHDMFVVATNWLRFGQPQGLFDENEVRFGIHGGDIETSIMLHYRPDLVRIEKAKDFVPSSAIIEATYKRLRATGGISFAWMTEDLHPLGAVGNAAAATAEKGQKSADYAASAFIELVDDVLSFPLEQLFDAE